MEKGSAYTLIGIGLIFAGVIIIYTLFSQPPVIIKASSENDKSVASVDYAASRPSDFKTETEAEAKAKISYPINLNSATANELAEGVPGIGEVLASHIIEYRELYGAYSSVDELLIISGISEEKLSSIRQYLTVG